MAEVPASDAEMSPATQAPGAEAAGAQAAGAQPVPGDSGPSAQMTPQELAAFANAPAADITMEGVGKMFMHLSVQLQTKRRDTEDRR